MSAQSLKPGWKMVKFGEVVKNANLVERDPEANGVERIVGLEHIDPENLHVRRWNSVADGTSFTRKFVPGQTLFGKRRAYQRKVAYAEFEGICSGDILTFEPKNRKVLLPELLPFICQSDAFFDHALGTSAGSLSPRTSWKALKDFEFPLPPIDEQRRIAEILWAADEAVETQADVVQRAEALLGVALFSKLTSQDILTPLGEVAKIKHGWAFKSKYFSEDTNYPILLTPGNFTLDGELYFTGKNTKRYCGEIPEDYILGDNEIVVVMTDLTPSARLLGMPSFIRSEETILHNQRIGKLKYDAEKILPEFLYFNLLSDGYRRQVRQTASGSTVKHTSPDRLLSAKIFLPPIHEQRELNSCS